MRRVWLGGALAAALSACRHYDFYDPVADQGGLIPASQYARYGTEQAQAIAIGRSLSQWHGGDSPEARATMVTKAAEYAKTLPGVASVVADTMGYRLEVAFRSGWRTFIVPIDDGQKPEDSFRAAK